MQWGLTYDLRGGVGTLTLGFEQITAGDVVVRRCSCV